MNLPRIEKPATATELRRRVLAQQNGQAKTPPRTRCFARHTHPLSSDFFVRCEREFGHDGAHINDDYTWSDNG